MRMDDLHIAIYIPGLMFYSGTTSDADYMAQMDCTQVHDYKETREVRTSRKPSPRVLLIFRLGGVAVFSPVKGYCLYSPVIHDERAKAHFLCLKQKTTADQRECTP